jgi:radical SAM protein with 4Fe4S-binding SPASM domain
MVAWEPHPVVVWELSRVCDLHCRGCPTGANELRDSNELSTYEVYKTIDQIADLRPRELILTGGDPLVRADLDQIIDYAHRRGLEPSLVFTPSEALTFDAVADLRKSGLVTAVFSVDGSTAAIHESVHGVPDTFAVTLRAMWWAARTGLRIEVNTLVTQRNHLSLPAIAAMLRPFGIVRWNVHLLVPTGAARELEIISPAEAERVFAVVDEIRAQETFAVRLIEAPHYRRFRLQRVLETRLASTGTRDDDDDVLDLALDGARAFVHITHAGEVRPSQFAPHTAGNLRYRPLGDIYRGSDLFVALRDADNLRGKCRRCDFRVLCGGSRSRAYAMTGDLFGADPLCAYEPAEQNVTMVSRGRDSST